MWVFAASYLFRAEVVYSMSQTQTIDCEYSYVQMDMFVRSVVKCNCIFKQRYMYFNNLQFSC